MVLKEFNQSAFTKFTYSEFLVILIEATFKESKLTSVHVINQSGLSLARASPIAPEPVPRSKTCLLSQSKLLRTFSTKSSVSGLGTNTCRFIKRSRFQNPILFVR